VSFFLGIDGGGSKTVAVVGDEKSILGTGRSGPSNVVRVGEAQARRAMIAAINDACEEAQVNPVEIARSCIGIAGGARTEIAGAVRRIAGGVVSGEVEIVGDMVIALEAAFGRSPGVIVIAGTGSIAYGRNAVGETARAGGWGFAISDEGSAHWIGRASIAAAMQIYDRKPALLSVLMNAWHVRNPEELVMAANASPSPDFAALFPVVGSAAESGDPLARGVLQHAGEELSRLAVTVIERLFRQEEIVQVAIAGGVFRNAALVRKAFYNHLHVYRAGIKGNETIVDPVKGALEMARRRITRENQ
jgi:N-acetylglucosamine kinase-like BadF-type ATPase